MAGRELQKAKSLKELDMNEGSMKEAMWRDAERMSLEQFVDKYGDEEWVREFWNSIMGDIEETVGGGNWLEETTALTGQYGHSGKLQPVKGTNADMMDRIRFLAGITK
jgi:hypothetical protein